MTIPTITPSPAAPSRTGDAPATFATKADAFTAWWATVGGEINATVGGMNAVATTIDAQALQVAADALETAADAQTAQEVYDAIVTQSMSELTGTSGSAVSIGLGSKTFTASAGKLWYQGMSIILRSSASATSFMVGEIASYDVATGALTVTVYVVGGSGSHSDWLIYPAGHRYDPRWTTIQTLSTASGSTVTFANIPQTFEDLRLLSVGASHNNGSDTSLLMSLSDNGTDYTTAATAGDSIAASATWYGSILVPGYREQEGSIFPGAKGLSGTRALAHNSANLITLGWKLPGPITHIRLQPNAGSFDGGAVVLLGRG